MKKWFLYNKKADFKAIGEKFGVDQVTARILRNRDVCTEEEIQRFLQGGMEDLYSPLLLPDAIRCMNRLDRTLSEGKRIRIVGDYDVDGVMATYILYKGLSRFSDQVDYVIPDRVKDGYGINISIIEKAHADGISLLLTCDNGISALEELRHARELGMDVIVTDHHDVRQEAAGSGQPADQLPPAAAVVDPKRQGSRYPYPEICGAVVAWKMVQLLFEKRNLPASEAEEFLEFAAVATVCDVVRLRDENRIIVRQGLLKLRETGNIGMQALIEAAGLSDQPAFNTYHIGFVLGPCINAGGRLQSAELALRMFLAEQAEEARALARQLKELNDARKDMTQAACGAAYAQAEGQYAKDKVLVLYLPDLHESLAGIVAGRVRERYYRPCFIITDTVDMPKGNNAIPQELPLDPGAEARSESRFAARSDPGLEAGLGSGTEAGLESAPALPMAKGSGRSIEGYPMAERLHEAAGLLTKYGGHPLAAGFSLPRENIGALRAFLNQHCALSEAQLMEKVWIDVPMPIDYIREDLIEDFEKLAPFGQGNPRPLFACKGLKMESVQVLGRNRNAVRIGLLSPGGCRMTGMLFMDGARFLREKAARDFIDIVYYPVINVFRERRTLQVQIQDYQFA